MENKSDKIRGLYDKGYSVSQISKHLGVRYQFAYNVVKQYERDKLQDARREVAASIEEPKEDPAVKQAWQLVRDFFKKIE